jgi:hypothetical protein
MKTLAGTLLIGAMAAATLPSLKLNAFANRNAPQLPYEEVNAYFENGNWSTGGTQCDGSREVTIIKPIGETKSVHLMSFLKASPSRRSEVTLRQKGETECGMMKCYTNYSGATPYTVMDSNYRDEDTWIHAVLIGKGKSSEANLKDCRRLERERLAMITDARTVYVTQSTNGQLQYTTFNYQRASATPSLIVKNGKSTLDSSRNAESFTFTNAGYLYEINVSTSAKPFAEVVVKKDGKVIQTERVLAYSYARRS